MNNEEIIKREILKEKIVEMYANCCTLMRNDNISELNKNKLKAMQEKLEKAYEKTYKFLTDEEIENYKKLTEKAEGLFTRIEVFE